MKIKWGVIGCGGIADRRTIPGMMLADNAELVAVMDANGEVAEKVRQVVAYDVSAMTGINVIEVNINIANLSMFSFVFHVFSCVLFKESFFTPVPSKR